MQQTKSLHRRLSALFGLFVLMAGLAGCAAFRTEDFPCPETGKAFRAETIAVFADSSKNPPTEADVAARATILTYRGACRTGRDGAVEFALDIDFSGQKGPAAAAKLKQQSFPYFIAVLSNAETILQREAFSTRVSFDNTGAGLSTEKHVLRLPPATTTDIRTYRVAVGFVLTPEQYAHNKPKVPDHPGR